MHKLLMFAGALSMLLTSLDSRSQVDTTYIFNTGMPYGTLDIRLAKSATRYYYLQEGKTFSFRESGPGVKTESYRDMTSWDSSPYTQGNMRERSGTLDFFIMNYRLLFPLNYNAGYADGYPLIIMMHGLGERGNCWDNSCYWADRSWRPTSNTPPAPVSTGSELLNNDHNLLHGGAVHLAARNAAGSTLPNDPSLPARSFPGFVLFPQNLNGWDGGSIQDAIRLVRLIVKKYNINPDRIYVHGLSNGGAAVFDVIKRAPWLFAAAATMSAVSDAGIINQGLTSNILSIPVWMFQGGLDTAPSPAKSEGYVKKFRESGLTVRYTRYDHLGHGTWNDAYNEPDFFSWLRSNSKAAIHIFADNPSICASTGQGVRMDLSAGFLAYQWQKDGVTIAGATGPTFTADTPGIYRARFSRVSKTPSESQWNDWSESVTITSATTSKPSIVQTGTVKLRDLNNYGNARLHSDLSADQYFWYKDGVLVNLPGNMDDTTRYVTITPGDCSSGTCSNNGIYTLVTSQFGGCKSTPSDPVYIFFNNQAPVNIATPSSFTGNAISENAAILNWTDASSNEGGFEIWRRKQVGTGSFTSWSMATLTGPDIEMFNDSGLDPSSTYQYKIRAVSDSGRSNYMPPASNAFLVITTSGDNNPPTPPQGLTATSTGIREITLTWQASSDDNGIRQYTIFYGSTSVATGAAATTYRLTDLPLNTNFSFTVKAEDVGGNLSASSNTAEGSTFVNGLYYGHTTGSFSDIDNINWSMTEYTGSVPNFTLAPRTQDDFFNFEFQGYLYINSGGWYEFQTSSDDGSRVVIDNMLAVDNDGLHGTQTVTGPRLKLGSGAREINVRYFEATGDQTLTVRYRGPDTHRKWVIIPDMALRSGNDATVSAVVHPQHHRGPSVALQGTIYPNPASTGSDITLQVSATDEAHPFRIKVVDFYGVKYFETTVSPSEMTSGLVLNAVERLGAGLYIVFIEQDGRIIRKTLSVKD